MIPGGIMKKSKSISYLLALSMLMSNASAFAQVGVEYSDFSNQPQSKLIQADIHSIRIPAGTVLKIRMETPINTLNSSEGDPFTATITEDVKVGNSILLPTGTIIRGSVSYIKRTGLPSRCGELYMNFDHIVTPVGKQIPLYAKFAQMDGVTPEGALRGKGNYVYKVKQGYHTGIKMVKDATNYGIDTGSSFWGGYPVIVTVPLSAAGGVFGGTLAFAGKSVAALFQRGDDVILGSGQVLEIALRQPLDIPAN